MYLLDEHIIPSEYLQIMFFLFLIYISLLSSLCLVVLLALKRLLLLWCEFRWSWHCGTQQARRTTTG